MGIRENAAFNDKLIQDLAIYEVTKGTMKMLKKDEDVETIHHRFSEYKGLIMRGEMTFEELEDRIIRKYGIIEPLVPLMPTNIEAPPRPMTAAEEKAIAEQNLNDFLGEITGILKEEAKKGTEEPVEEPQEPYPWYKRIWDKIRLTCSRFYVNI